MWYRTNYVNWPDIKTTDLCDLYRWGRSSENVSLAHGIILSRSVTTNDLRYICTCTGNFLNLAESRLATQLALLHHKDVSIDDLYFLCEQGISKVAKTAREILNIRLSELRSTCTSNSQSPASTATNIGKKTISAKEVKALLDDENILTYELYDVIEHGRTKEISLMAQRALLKRKNVSPYGLRRVLLKNYYMKLNEVMSTSRGKSNFTLENPHYSSIYGRAEKAILAHESVSIYDLYLLCTSSTTTKKSRIKAQEAILAHENVSTKKLDWLRMRGYTKEIRAKAHEAIVGSQYREFVLTL